MHIPFPYFGVCKGKFTSYRTVVEVSSDSCVSGLTPARFNFCWPLNHFRHFTLRFSILNSNSFPFPSYLLSKRLKKGLSLVAKAGVFITIVNSTNKVNERCRVPASGAWVLTALAEFSGVKCPSACLLLIPLRVVSFFVTEQTVVPVLHWTPVYFPSSSECRCDFMVISVTYIARSSSLPFFYKSYLLPS